MKKRLLAILALLLCLTFMLVACGGDEEEEPSENLEGEFFEVTFNLNYEGAPELEGREVEYNQKIGELPTPYRKGFIFEGWYAEDDTEFTTKYTSAKKVTGDLVLVAKWSPEPPCAHSAGYKTIGYTPLSCTTNHMLVKQCRNPQCNNEQGRIITTLIQEAQGHDLKTTNKEPTCYQNGKIITKCKREDCDYRVEEIDPNALATGEHVYTDWYVTLEPTDYAYGEKRQACMTVGCVEGKVDVVEPKNVALYDTLDIKTVSHGDKKYVNVASTATAYATSLYRLTLASNVLDGAPATYWRADTLVDGTSYTGDQLTVEFLTAYEFKTVELVLPNYYGWALGDDCYVKYDVEMFVDDAWVKVGEISDADNRDPKSQKVTVSLALTEPKTTSKIRFTVTHAGRYTPAMICEVAAYAYLGNDQVLRRPQSIGPLATGFITGSYNAWVDSSAANLLDNKTVTSWCTDARVWWENPVYNSNKYLEDITNWMVEYGVKDNQNNVDPTKSIGNVVVKASKVIVGETIEVWACRSWNEQRMQNQKVKLTDEQGNPLLDENGNEIWETLLDPEGKPLKEPAKDENGNDIWDTKTEWISFGKYTVKEGDTGTYTFTPKWKDSEGKEQTSALDGVSVVRVEVDNYGADEVRDHHYITGVTINESGTNKDYNDIKLTNRRKVYASFTFPTPQFIAYIQISCDSTRGREMSLQKWVEDTNEADGGYWVELKRLEVGDVSAPYAKFTVDIGEYLTAFRLEVTRETARFGAYVNDVIPYTVAEIAQTLPENESCPHKYTKAEPVEIVAPTCTSAGYTVYECMMCDKRWKTDAIEANGHKWGQAVADTDLNNNKVNEYSCTSGCGATKLDVTEYRTGDGYIAVPKVTKYYHNAPASWSMTFDDGNYIDTYEWVYPELAKRHMKATAVLTIQYSSGYVTDWKKYVASGAFDIGSHSSFHAGPFTGEDMDEITLGSEIDDAFYTLMSWVPGQRVIGFATPNGATGAGTANFVNDLMLGGRSGGQAGTYCDPDSLTTREQWGNLPSYITYRTTTFGASASEREGVDYKGAIDHIVKNGLWTADCIHTIDVADTPVLTDKFSVPKSVFEKKLDYFVKTGVWVSSYNEALLYFREAHAASVSSMTVGSTQISVEITDGLDDVMFQQPLTFEFNLPSGWTNVTVTQNGVSIPVVKNDKYAPNMAEDMACTVKNGVLYFDAIPDAGTVVISKVG